jgi:pimeloyl-ACP methyl ester carboxylesterase
MPDRSEFSYTFDNFARIIEDFTEALSLRRYALYMMDYGGPVGYRIASHHPERVVALVIQNANAYEEGLQSFWDPFRAYWADNSQANRDVLAQFLTLDVTRFQYTYGVPDVSLVSPDTWTTDQYLLDRPGNKDIQLDLFYDYRNNVALYPQWQAYFRQYQPPTLIVWGKNDVIFPAAGAEPFKRDLTNLEFHLLDTGHFALESNGPEIARLMRRFLDRVSED